MRLSFLEIEKLRIRKAYVARGVHLSQSVESLAVILEKVLADDRCRLCCCNSRQKWLCSYHMARGHHDTAFDTYFLVCIQVVFYEKIIYGNSHLTAVHSFELASFRRAPPEHSELMN